MVERAAAGEAPSSPQPPEAGAPQGQALRRLVRRRESEPTDNAVKPSQCRLANVASDPVQPTLNMWPTCPWRRGAPSDCAVVGQPLPLADMREDGAEVLVLDDGGLRNLPQLVEGGVGQVEPTVADRQPAVRIIGNGDALATKLASDLVR